MKPIILIPSSESILKCAFSENLSQIDRIYNLKALVQGRNSRQKCCFRFLVLPDTRLGGKFLSNNVIF